MKTLVSILVLIGLVGCAGSTEKRLEEAQFALIDADYAAAVTLAEAILEDEPSNVEAKMILSTGLLGRSVLGEGETFLGLLADVLENAEETGGGDPLPVFLVIAPALTTAQEWEDIQEARDTLLSIPAASRDEDTYLQLYMARMFEISGSLTRTEVDPDGTCIAIDALSTDDRERFRENVAEINGDGDNARLPDSFGLTDVFTDMDTALDTAIGGGSVADGVETFFLAQFGQPAC